MEGKCSIEVIEIMCENETDGNAQVTSPVSVQEVQDVTPQDVEEVDYYEPPKKIVSKEFSMMQTTSATNWLLLAIFLLLFLFMIFKCD